SAGAAVVSSSIGTSLLSIEKHVAWVNRLIPLTPLLLSSANLLRIRLVRHVEVVESAADKTQAFNRRSPHHGIGIAQRVDQRRYDREVITGAEQFSCHPPGLPRLASAHQPFETIEL